jgi:hypothetical protein
MVQAMSQGCPNLHRVNIRQRFVKKFLGSFFVLFLINSIPDVSYKINPLLLQSKLDELDTSEVATDSSWLLTSIISLKFLIYTRWLYRKLNLVIILYLICYFGILVIFLSSSIVM